MRWTWDSEDQITNKLLLVIIIEGIPQTAIYLILSIGLIPVFVRFSCLQRFFPFSCLAGRGRWGQTCKDLRIRRFMVCGLCVGVKWQEWETEKQIHTCSASKYFSLSSIKFYILNLFRQSCQMLSLWVIVSELYILAKPNIYTLHDILVKISFCRK